MPYNVHNYNEQRYNINGVYYLSSLTETVTGVDGTQLASLLKALSDSFSETDSIVFMVEQPLIDFAFLDDSIQIQFTNKALADTLRLADWLSIERNPAHNGWFD